MHFYLIDYLIQIIDFDGCKIIDELLNNIKIVYDSPVENEAFFSLIVLFTGHLSSSSKGEYLLSFYKIYNSILRFIDICTDLNMIKYLISVLDYINRQ